MPYRRNVTPGAERRESQSTLTSRHAAPLLAIASGILCSAAFPPLAWRWTAWISLVPLFIIAASARPLRVAACGALFALAFVVSVAWWSRRMLSLYYHLAPLQSLAFLTGIGLLYALAVVPAVALISHLRKAKPLFPLTAAACWFLAELLRANIPPRNPFYLLGSSQFATPFIQVADLFGVYGVSMLAAAANAAIASLLLPAFRPRSRIACASIGVAVLAATLYGAVQESRWRVSGTPVRVALVQGGITYDREAGSANERAVVERYRRLHEIATRGADLVVLPEHAINFLFTEPPPYLVPITRHFARSTTILGGPYESGTLLFNSVFLVDRGRIIARHDKVRLLPFAEDDLIEVVTREKGLSFQSGRDPHPLGDAGVMICSEALEPGLARQLSIAGARVLVNPSNDSWLPSAGAARAELEAAAVRAVENRRDLLRATSTGISAIIDAGGHVVASSEFGGHAIVRDVAYRREDRTIYQRLGNAPLIVASMAILAAAFLRRSVIGSA